jgi:hypothetical protein
MISQAEALQFSSRPGAVFSYFVTLAGARSQQHPTSDFCPAPDKPVPQCSR